MAPSPLQILLVDDDPAMQRLLRKWLETAGYAVATANDGRDAQQLLVDHAAQLLITDWDMPHMDGLGLCTWLRQQKTQNYIYTIFLTSRSASQDLITALETGADDFIKKPVDKGELLARVRSAARVLELERRLNVLAQTDPLTGLMSRRTFFEMVEREWARSERHLFPLSCVMIDIDYFKRINDTHGHLAGDHALRNLAKVLQQNCRGSDSIGRYGGEEFCVLLPETTEAEAIAWAERVRQTIAASSWTMNEIPMRLTASFGVAQRTTAMRSPEDFVDHADQALLNAKRTGRDRVVGCQALLRSTALQPPAQDPAVTLRDQTAGDVMATNVSALRQDDSVGTAMLLFREHSTSVAPVVDPNGKLIGLVSDREILSILPAPQWWQMPVQEVMRTNVVCYEEDVPVLLIHELLCRGTIPAVFVVRNQQLVGTISRKSLLSWFAQQHDPQFGLPGEAGLILLETPATQPQVC